MITDTQIRVMGSIEPEMCMQMLSYLTEISKIPATTLSRLLRGKNCSCQVCFLRNILTGSKSSRRSITAAKR